MSGRVARRCPLHGHLRHGARDQATIPRPSAPQDAGLRCPDLAAAGRLLALIDSLDQALRYGRVIHRDTR
ncbi:MULTISPECIES: hypothetical protein [Streptomyces]|uniref:hypothetical protein n=1 Tax=Streptomyces TaxID=1883 RepID=UPI00292F0764|nr:hypothetical protein [Streptomyces sp. NEAU-HV9]